MTKRRNIVILHGPLTVDEVSVLEIDGTDVPAVMCWIETDRPALGGRHKVLAYGRLAKETLAFTQAQDGPIEVTINGWLRSTMQEWGVVIADRISFHAAAEVVERAKRRLAKGER